MMLRTWHGEIIMPRYLIIWKPTYRVIKQETNNNATNPTNIILNLSYRIHHHQALILITWDRCINLLFLFVTIKRILLVKLNTLKIFLIVCVQFFKSSSSFESSVTSKQSTLLTLYLWALVARNQTILYESLLLYLLLV